MVSKRETREKRRRERSRWRNKERKRRNMRGEGGRNKKIPFPITDLKHNPLKLPYIITYLTLFVI